MELEVPQFKYLDYNKQKAAKFMLSQLEDIGRGRMEKMMKERAKWEALDLRDPWNHVLQAENREGTHDPEDNYVPGMGSEERDEDDEDRELEELEALASAANGPFPTIWGEVPSLHGFSAKSKTTKNVSTQTDTPYTVQLVTVGPSRRTALGEKYWHFHNGPTMRPRSGSADEARTNTENKNKYRKKEVQRREQEHEQRELAAMPPPEEHQWKEAIRMSRDAVAKSLLPLFCPRECAHCNPPELTWALINQRARDKYEGSAAKVGTSDAMETMDTDSAIDWLTPFDPAESTAYATNNTHTLLLHRERASGIVLAQEERSSGSTRGAEVPN
jgi:hypothetical protein